MGRSAFWNTITGSSCAHRGKKNAEPEEDKDQPASHLNAFTGEGLNFMPGTRPAEKTMKTTILIMRAGTMTPNGGDCRETPAARAARLEESELNRSGTNPGGNLAVHVQSRWRARAGDNAIRGDSGVNQRFEIDFAMTEK